MLNAYLTQFNALIQAPNSPIQLISTTQATTYINTARGQVATEGECIRNYATLALAAATQQYPFSLIALAAGTIGVAGVINVRMAGYQIAAGQRRIVQREWEWFNRYVLQNPAPVPGPPRYMAQFGQGANGTLWFNLPDISYVVALDAVCLPSALAVDSDPEAIPYQWTDAVPFYAAWLGMMNEQRQGDAEAMMKRYQELMRRARGAATPSVTPHQYAQGPDLTLANQLGLQQRGGGG